MSNEEIEIEMPTLKEADEKNGVGVKTVNGVDGSVLLSYCERVEHIEAEKKSLRDFSIDALKFMLGAGKVTTAIAKAIEKAVCFFGKHALIVYVVHVVMLAAILSLISGLFITPGNFGF